MTARDSLLIVIPCLNEEAHLAALVDQFARDNPEAMIVVADGGSTDSSRSIVRDRAANATNLVLLENHQRIQAAGVNAAVQQYGSGREWLVRVDAHCDYPSDYAQKLVNAAHLHQARSVVVPMVSRGKSTFQIAAAAAQNSLLGTGGSPHRHVGKGGYVDHGHHALLNLRLFESVGGYREDMAANEDAELDRRLIASGARIWLEPSLAITYYPRSSPERLWRQYFKHGMGRARTTILHRARPKLRQLAPVGAAGGAALALLSPAWPWLAAPMLIWLGFTLLAGFVIGARTMGSRARLLAGFPAAIMHLSWGLGFTLEALRSVLPNRAGATRRNSFFDYRSKSSGS
jgi:succinoglycan biosynthesis protein ExoA